MTTSISPAELTRSFEAHRIDNSTFHHKQHLEVAFELLGKYDFVDATAIYAKGIKTIAANAGAPKKFNTTITFAFMSLIAERMEKSGRITFEAFLEDNPDLLSMKILEGWYVQEQLFSDIARKIFLMPRTNR